MLQAYEDRRRAVANRALDAASQQAQDALATGDALRAQEVLDAAAVWVEYAHPEIQSRWQRLSKEANRSNILSKIGLKGPRAI